MNELTPTTKAERDGFIADTQPDEYLFVKRLIADIDRRDALLRRIVEWDGKPPSSPDGSYRALAIIIADARKLLEDSQ